MPLAQNAERANQIKNMVEGEGFEPSKAEPTDLQSVPFDRSGTPPTGKAHILRKFPENVNLM